MNELSQILQSSTLFSCLSAVTIKNSIIPYGSVHEYPKNAALISPQEKTDHVFVLLSGRVHLMHLYPNGNHGLITALTPPKCLGIELVGTRTRISPYLATVVQPSSLFAFPADRILLPGFLRPEDQVAVMNQLLTMVSHFNMKKEYRLAILSQNGLRDRIMTYLTMQAAKRNSNTFEISLSREEMAAFLCVNRSALSHELSLMKKDGLILFSKNSFTILP